MNGIIYKFKTVQLADWFIKNIEDFIGTYKKHTDNGTATVEVFFRYSPDEDDLRRLKEVYEEITSEQ